MVRCALCDCCLSVHRVVPRSGVALWMNDERASAPGGKARLGGILTRMRNYAPLLMRAKFENGRRRTEEAGRRPVTAN